MAADNESTSPIWEYRSEDGRYRIEIFERADHLLVIRSHGVCRGEGALRLLKFLFDHSTAVGRRLSVICDNSELTHVDRTGRKAMASFAGQTSPIARLATFGDNFFLRAFTNLFAAVSQTAIKSVEDEAAALAWITGEGDER